MASTRSNHRTASLLVSLLTGLLVLALAVPAAAEIETITITATGRNASSQDVPISVTALTAETLERQGVTDIRGLVSIAPSLNINSSNTEIAGTTIRLRGVGTTGNNAGLEGSVGVFLDGVYLSRPGIAFTSLVDIERVEILRGPQGTLFGRNTSAGAIDIKTRKPVFNEYETRLEFDYGNYDNVITTGIFNIPLVDDQLAVRFSGTYQQSDGYLRSVYPGDPVLGYPAHTRSNDRDRYLLRGQALWQLNDQATLRVIADRFKGDERCCDAPIRYDSPGFQGLFDAVGPAFGFANNGIGTNVGKQALEGRRTNANRRRLNEQEQWGVSSELNIDHAYGTATLLTSYRSWSGAQAGDDDFTSNDLIDTQRSPGNNELFSSELRVQGTWEWLDWLVGGYFLDETIDAHGRLGLGNDYGNYVNMLLQGFSGGALSTTTLTGLPAGSNFSTATIGNNRYSQDGRSYSLFTHNVIDLGELIGTAEDRLHLTAGFRYTWEEKDGRYSRGPVDNPGCTGLIEQTRLGGGLNLTGALTPTAAGLICFPFASGATPEFDDSFDDKRPTGTVKLDYQFTDEVMAWASYSRGFKAGGFNLDSTAAIVNPLSGSSIPVDPANDAAPGNYLQVGNPTFESELVDAYEIGIKSDLLGERLRANGTFFYYDIENFQVLEFTGVQFVTSNVKEVTVKGFELETQAQVVDGLQVMFSFVYADAKYGTKGCTYSQFGGASLPDRVCGLRLTNAPPWTVNVGAVYSLPLIESSALGLPDFMGSGDVLATIYLNWQWKDARRAGTTEANQSPVPGLSEQPNARIQPASNTLDMRVAIHSEDYRWSIEGWGRNLTDTRTSSVLFAIPLRTGATGSFIDPPRMYGFTLRSAF